MKINAAGINVNVFKPAFKSTRTDKNTVQQLKNGEKPIIENNKQNIYAALNNLSAAPDKNNIEFLLDIASNLSYGQGSPDGEFKQILDEDGFTPEERENTNWVEILDDTIRKALQEADPSEDITELEAEYKNIRENNKKLSPSQKKLLDLRKTFTNSIINDSTLEDAQSLSMTARVRKNLDYFIASSEIPSKQKEECLEKFIYFMSDDYKITPQLEDKKLQVVDEMLNDMLIKTPEDKVLTIKSVDQRSSGMCAAISICRKMLAYEDKTRFVELITDELEDSPEMNVFDITELETGKKVKIPKTNVDYNTAIEKGYRIIDASAHNWMNNAHASGDGTIQTEHYIPFDEENYGIYDDTSWYLGLDDSLAPQKKLLKALIKEKEFLKSFNQTKKEISQVSRNVNSVKKEAYESQTLAIGKLNTILKDIFPEKQDCEISVLQKGLFDFYTGVNEDNEVNVPEKFPSELKSKMLADYIIENSEGITEEQKTKIRDKAYSVYLMTDEYTKADLKLEKLKKYNSPRSKYIYNRKLYNSAAAHRLAIEADVNMPDGVVRFERISGLPPRDVQISDYMKNLYSSFSSPSVRKRYKKEDGNIPSQRELEKELSSDLARIETTIPSELNSTVKNVTGQSIEEITASLFVNIAERIDSKESNLLDNTKMITGIKGDKNKVVSELYKWADKLSNTPSQREISEAVRLLGYEDNMQFADSILTTFFSSLQEGISEEEYSSMAERFGGTDKIVSGLSSQYDKFKKLNGEYSAITEKWQVPSARTNILSKLEKEHCVISRKKLDILKTKFSSISSAMAENEQIPNVKERQKANDKLYNFSNVEAEIFKNIEKTLPYMRKYSKSAYQAMNKALYDNLEKQYSDIGMLNGQFWVREEGSSGLSVNEQIRIIEQMTGKPYHMETDIIKASQEIKEGEGSGVISLSVDDTDYAFHAQYVPFVSSETFTNPLTNEKNVRDVIWTDNSWGKSEKEHYWNGQNGFSYTDYDRGFGWKDGFVLSDDFLIGLPVEDISGAVGTAKEDDDKFGLFTDLILPGTPVNAYQKLYKMFGYIFSIGDSKILLEKLEEQIANGSRFNIKELDGLDDVAEIKTENIMNRLEKEINSKEDFDKLPDDDELKFIFNKIAVYLSTDNPNYQESILTVDNNEDLEKAKEEIYEGHVSQMGAIAGKSDEAMENLYEYSLPEFEELFKNLNQNFLISVSEDNQERILQDIFFDEEAIKNHDGTLKGLEEYLYNQINEVARKNIKRKRARNFFTENAQNIIHNQIDTNIRIKSFDSPNLFNNPLGKELISSIDKYLKPKSDEELLMLIQGLQDADYETANKFFDALEPEDVGINVREPYYYVKLFKADNSIVTKAFSDIIATSVIYQNMNTSGEDEESTPEEIYRDLYVKLSEMDVQKYINAFKAEAFQKYQVRQAFPQPVVISDDLLMEKVQGMLEVFEQSSDEIEVDNLCLEVLHKYSQIKNVFVKEAFCQDLLSGSDVKITEENIEVIDKFKNLLEDLSAASSEDTSLLDVNQQVKILISSLNEDTKTIDGKTAGTALRNILNIFDEFERTGVNEDKFIQLKNEEINQINSQVRLMVNSNVEPKYRNDAAKLIYEYINLYKNKADDEKLTEKSSEILSLFVEKHIVKNPTALLNECVKLLFEGKSSSDEYKVLRTYLEEALKTAQQTKIQYKLVKNQHEGIGSKTKELLPLFNVKLSDGSDAKMDSEYGMMYLMENLKNENDNYSIMNLFLDQSGLSKCALRALINNFDIENSYKLVDTQAEKIQTNIKDLNNLMSVVDLYNRINKVGYKSLKKSIDALNNFLKRRLKDYKNVPVYDNYIKYLSSLIYSEESKNYTPEMASTLAEQIEIDAFSYILDIINSQIKYLQDISGLLDERTEMINSIRVPVNSEEYDLRCEFLDKFADLQSHILQKNKEIMETSDACPNLGAEKIYTS